LEPSGSLFAGLPKNCGTSGRTPRAGARASQTAPAGVLQRQPAGVQAMAVAGTVAVILPGAFYTLRETQAPPIDRLREAGVPMAVATDCNPGSSPMTSLPLAMNMACTLFRLTPEEALLGTTAHAARALGLTDRGRIAPGLRADLAVWDAAHPAELSYRIGSTALHKRIVGGRLDT
jgi:imidazolonepropionase